MGEKLMRNRICKMGLVFIIIILFIGAINSRVFASKEVILFNSNNSPTRSNTEPRNIMLTGYWNPTGQMIAQFSNDSYLNPDGWKGANWEGWGFNIYSFFPTPGAYNGTFEVDYQDTLEDFWSITEEINPIAIISFGAGAGPWEIEYNARNLDEWVPDNDPPYQPTPCPPDDSKPINYVRHSTLPVQSIADAVNSQTTINAWVDWNGNPGAYLCEYMAYLGMWYQDIHNMTNDPYPCLASGFIHVTSTIPLEDAMHATNVTIREVIKFLLGSNSPPDAPTIAGPNTGFAGKEYKYTFVTTDPEEENVSYYIDWGDGTNSGWLGAYSSGIEIKVNHSWVLSGEYEIRAKAMDENSYVGNWSDPFPVTIY